MRRIPETFDSAIRREVARSRGLDNLTADPPMDLKLRANAAAARGASYIPPRNFTKGRVPRPAYPPSYSGVKQSVIDISRRTTR
jgi:hypothetical protein